MGGKNAGSTQSQSTLPPGYIQDAQKNALGQASTLYGDGGGPTDPNTAFTPYSQQSQMGIQSMGQAGQQLGGQAVGQIGDTLGGQYLGGSNPYLQDLVARSSRNAMSGINSTFGGAGRTGGGLHQQALATGLGDTAASIYAPAYESERNRQLGAVNQVGGAMQGFGSQIQAGGMMENKDMQQQLAQMATQNQPYSNVGQYAGLINQIGGGAGMTASSPQEGRGMLAGGLGGALSGGAIGTAFGGPGIGTAIGGAAGLLGLI